MRYEPKNMTCVELLTQAGFTSDHPGSRGMIRPYLNRRDRKRAIRAAQRPHCIVLRRGEKIHSTGHRLHAIIEGDTINLHYDTNMGGSHRSSKFASIVHQTIKELEALDIPKTATNVIR